MARLNQKRRNVIKGQIGRTSPDTALPPDEIPLQMEISDFLARASNQEIVQPGTGKKEKRKRNNAKK